MKIFGFLRGRIKKIFTVTDEKAEISTVSIIVVSLSEKEILFILEPKDLIGALNEYINLVVNTIREFNGIIVRSNIPEEVLAIFRNKEHQKFACEAAIEIIERFKKWKETSPLSEKIPSLNIATLNVVIGINTGKAIVAKSKDVVTGKDFYDALGESVNVAMRLQKECLNLGKQNLVSESTYEPVKDIVSAKNTDEVLINMKDKQIKAYELVSQK